MSDLFYWYYVYIVKYFIGVDEAGRGALAGPVCVGTVFMPNTFDWQGAYALVTRHGRPRLRDSKQLSAQQRDVLYEYITAHVALKYSFAFVDAQTIDEIGIVNAAHEAASVAVQSLGVSPLRVEVLLDAGLCVSGAWTQHSFVRGDETIPVIALASIVAKVARDRFMEECARSHTRYRFDEHKGYGTLAHRKAIRKYGVCPLHRRTFLSDIVS
ncbi:hypothetical protein A2673_01360 [Candidatus Kaiserbacteria bacterium RIFCSPHIGHO2_01_FULL_50_13]|nr:MAG: hypothetical protein A2673_01360 [Candidatus Kaiserbacteria bacterium RIFCSPHIGHO2_01_FULL_50_13]OGG82021.1 MAG: hypothetical protein A3H74_00855 [Candidatus Kaiserbacteria bacterium RIFCSPLOWO2_02_FULL_51_13]